MDIEIVFTSPDDETAGRLLDLADASLVDLYGSCSDIPRNLFAAPEGGYLVAWHGIDAVAGGGFTKHDDVTAEIRRMYVVPSARSRGVARRLLAAIEGAAEEARYTCVILDTGPLQPHAEALYRSAGYTDIDNYRTSSTRGSYWGEKTFDDLRGL